MESLSMQWFLFARQRLPRNLLWTCMLIVLTALPLKAVAADIPACDWNNSIFLDRLASTVRNYVDRQLMRPGMQEIWQNGMPFRTPDPQILVSIKQENAFATVAVDASYIDAAGHQWHLGMPNIKEVRTDPFELVAYNLHEVAVERSDREPADEKKCSVRLAMPKVGDYALQFYIPDSHIPPQGIAPEFLVQEFIVFVP